MTQRSAARLSRALSLTLLASLVVLVWSTPALAATHKIVASYFEEWSIYGANYDVSDIEVNGVAKNLDIVYYAFGNVTNGACSLADIWADWQSPFVREVPGATPWIPASQQGWVYTAPNGNFADLIQLKQLHPGLKVVISLGGASAANTSGFATAAATDAGRKALVSSCIKLFINGTDNLAPGIGTGSLFDGIDVDWEFPTAADKTNFTALMAEFRGELDAFGKNNGGKHYLLSYAAPAGKQNFSNIELGKVGKLVDYVNIENYDYHGTWETSTNHAAPLFDSPFDPVRSQNFNIEYTERAYLRAGVAPRKILLGVPLYARGWTGVPGVHHGLYQTSSGAAPAPGDELATDGVATLDFIAANQTGYTTYLDPFSLVNWEYNPTTQTFWSYETPESATIKAIYDDIRVRGGLGGAFTWAVKDDVKGTILQTLRDNLF